MMGSPVSRGGACVKRSVDGAVRYRSCADGAESAPSAQPRMRSAGAPPAVANVAAESLEPPSAAEWLTACRDRSAPVHRAAWLAEARDALARSRAPCAPARRGCRPAAVARGGRAAPAL